MYVIEDIKKATYCEIVISSSQKTFNKVAMQCIKLVTQKITSLRTSKILIIHEYLPPQMNDSTVPLF